MARRFLIALVLPCCACPGDDDSGTTPFTTSIGSDPSSAETHNDTGDPASTSDDATSSASTATTSTSNTTSMTTTTVGDDTSVSESSTDPGTTTDPGTSTGGSSSCDDIAGEDFIVPGSCDGPGGNTSTEVPSNGLFSTSWFGCYYDNGEIIQDPGDNCEFACGDRGLCPGLSGPECEAELQWFAADADRFGCGGRIRVTNCENGNAVILTTLDRGPNCNSVEMECGAPVLDVSHDAMVYLFDGNEYGGCDLQGVVVEPVDDSTPLGPV